MSNCVISHAGRSTTVNRLMSGNVLCCQDLGSFLYTSCHDDHRFACIIKQQCVKSYNVDVTGTQPMFLERLGMANTQGKVIVISVVMLLMTQMCNNLFFFLDIRKFSFF